MASQNLTETNEYENLLTSIQNLDEENEPFTYGAGGWTVIKPQLRLSKKNPWYKVLMNLGNALETGNLSYNQKRILLDEYEKQFKAKTKCGEGSIKRAKEGEEPRELDRRKHGTDLCDLIGWNINGLAELYTPIELLNNELNELKNEDIGKPLSKKNSWRNLWLKIIHKINSFPTKLKNDENLKNLVLKFKERFEETNCDKNKERTACYLINKGLDKLWDKYKDDLIIEVPSLIELAARKVPAENFEAVSSEMMLDARAAEAREGVSSEMMLDSRAAEARKGGKKRKSKRKRSRNKKTLKRKKKTKKY